MECPGSYCGRSLEKDGVFSQCGACAGGSRVNSSWRCEGCEDMPSTYDWMYLCFMACVPLLLNTIFIHISVNKHSHHHLIFHLSALLESTFSFLLSLLFYPPIGSLHLLTCASRDLSDWYSIFLNPTIDYTYTLYCSQDAVYPLYSIVFVMNVTNLTLTLIMRVLLSRCLHHPCPCSLYASLFLHPPLATIHALFAGLIYYTYPYIILVVSMVTNAMHFASFQAKTPGGLLKELVCSVGHMCILFMHTTCVSFAVFSLLQCSPFAHEFSLFFIVPLPPLIYIITAPFTQPHLLTPTDKELSHTIAHNHAST